MTPCCAGLVANREIKMNKFGGQVSGFRTPDTVTAVYRTEARLP